MKKNLPNVTLVTVDCVDLSRSKLAADICQKDFSFGSVKILSSISDSDPRVVPIQSVKSTEEYSDFCIKELWKYIDTDYALVFQYDGFILNPSAWTDEFFKYDYIGAPWYHVKNLHVGNGGFSLRSRALLEYVGKNYEKIGGKTHPEDYWISKTARPFLEKEEMKFAPLDVASRFSKEGNQRSVFWNGEFGFHGLNYTDISKWLALHPEYENTIKNNLNELSVLMQKYPDYDGTVHVIYCKPIQISHYKKLGLEQKNYDCRMVNDVKDWDKIEQNHIFLYSPFRISVSQVGISPFERRVKKIETFSSKKDLLAKHPHIKITPSFNIPKWKQRLVAIFGNIIFPDKKQYVLFDLEKVNG